MTVHKLDIRYGQYTRALTCIAKCLYEIQYSLLAACLFKGSLLSSTPPYPLPTQPLPTLTPLPMLTISLPTTPLPFNSFPIPIPS